jgi:hypothetical protein
MGLDGMEEGMHAFLLADDAAYADLARSSLQFVCLVQGKHHDGNIGEYFEDVVGSLEAVGVLHLVIHHDQVRMQFLGFTDGLFAILSFAANFPILTQLEQMLEGIAHGFAVLCNEDASRGPRRVFLSWVHQNFDGVADKLTIFYKQNPRHAVQSTSFARCATYGDIPTTT